MVGWHHQLKGHEFEQILGDGKGQGSLSCCSPLGCKSWTRLSKEQQTQIINSATEEQNGDFLWKWKSLSCVLLIVTPRTVYIPRDYPGQNTGVGSLSFLQGIFPAQGSNPDLPHSRWTLYQLSHKKSPRILEWVAYHFSRGYSWPRNQTGVSGISGGFFTNWATVTKFLANMLSR